MTELLPRITALRTDYEEFADMCDFGEDYETLADAEKAIKRYLELTEPLEAGNRSKMTDRELDYLQLRHDLLGRET